MTVNGAAAIAHPPLPEQDGPGRIQLDGDATTAERREHGIAIAATSEVTKPS